MQYKPAIITKPLQWENQEDITIGVKGDSFFIGLTPDLDNNLNTLEAPSVTNRKNGYAWLSLDYQDIVTTVTEGESFTLEVNINNTGTGVEGWGDPNFIYVSSSGGVGVKASILDDNIVVQTGSAKLLSRASSTGSPFGNTDSTESAPCRVKVWNVY